MVIENPALIDRPGKLFDWTSVAVLDTPNVLTKENGTELIRRKVG